MAIVPQSYTLVDADSGAVDIGTAGNDRLVVVVAYKEELDVTQPSLSGVTVDGKACALQKKQGVLGARWQHAEMWSIHEGQLGASAGSVTVALTGADADWAFEVVLVYGVGQRDADTTYSGTATNSLTVSVTGVNASIGDYVLMAATHETALRSWASWTSPLTERWDTSYNATETEAARAAGADAVLASALSSATLTGTITSTASLREVALCGVWSEPGVSGTGATTSPVQAATGSGTLGPVPSQIDTNDGGARKVQVVDTRRRERAEERARRERDAREAERRRIIDRVFREVIDGLPPELAPELMGDPEFVAQAVEEELARQGLGPVKDIAALIASARTAHRRAVEQRNNDALALLLLAS